MAGLALAALSAVGIGGTAATAGAIASGAAIAGGATATALGGTLAAGATIAGGATAGALSSQLLGILSGVTTAASVLGTLNTGFESARQANQSADEATLDEGQQQLQSLESQNQLRRELFKVMGENRTAIAAAGIDVGGGGIAQSQDASATREATRSLSIERRDDDLRRAMLRARAQGYRRQAGSAIGGSLVRAIGTGADYGISLANRG